MTKEVNKHGVPVQPPLIPEVGVVSMVPEVWGNPWQSRHFILTRLARYFHVVWFNPVREWRQILFNEEIPGQTGRFEGGSKGPGFHIYNAGILSPRLHKPRNVGNYLRRRRLRKARSILLKKGCKEVILYNWRPEFAPAHDWLEHDVSCFHIDDEYSFSRKETAVDRRELEIIERVDQVFIHSPALMEKKGHINPNTAMIPNGVEYQRYCAEYDEPDELRSIPHPRIGYVGYIKRQLDYDLQLALAREHPEWSFVYVGPKGILDGVAAKVDELMALPNVHYLGFKAKERLASFAQHMDILFMAYNVDDYTKYIYPLKIHEFLATGHPVISTPIQSLRQFEGPVYLARTKEEWENKIALALSEAANAESEAATRKAIAKEHDWDVLADRVTSLLCERLGQDYADRFRKIHEEVTAREPAV